MSFLCVEIYQQISLAFSHIRELNEIGGNGRKRGNDAFFRLFLICRSYYSVFGRKEDVRTICVPEIDVHGIAAKIPAF